VRESGLEREHVKEKEHGENAGPSHEEGEAGPEQAHLRSREMVAEGGGRGPTCHGKREKGKGSIYPMAVFARED
jgi:hypothetical protein